MQSNENTGDNFPDPDITNTTGLKNVLWLQTTYEDFIRNPNLISDTPLIGNDFRCALANGNFYLEVKKASEAILSVSCRRKSIRSPDLKDDGYFLRVHFTLIGVEHETISTVMYPFEDSVTVHYLTHMFSDTPSENLYVATVKCVIRMVETEELPGKHLDEIEYQCQNFTKKFSKSQLKNMAYLLNRPKLRKIFTGRENGDIILTRLSYIERAMPYSKQISKYMKNKETSESSVTEIPLDEILCVISCGEKRPIREEECISLFLNAIRIGLSFLYAIVSDYIVSTFNNDFVVDVLKAADSANDRKMFEAASKFFLTNRSQILQSEKWKRLANASNNCYARSIIHNLKLQHTLEDPYTAPGLFEETREI